MATYKDMFKRVARSAGFDSSDAAFSDGSDNTALVKELINESNKMNAALSSLRPKSGSITTSAGVSSYALPADFNLMRYVWYFIGTRKIEITKIEEKGFLKMESFISQSQFFVHYTIREDVDVNGLKTSTLFLFPTPGTSGQTIYLDYLAGAADLNIDPSVTTDQNTNLVAPLQFDSIDKYYALKEIYANREQLPNDQNYTQKYEKMLERMREFVGRRSESIVVKQGLETQINPNLYPILTQ